MRILFIILLYTSILESKIIIKDAGLATVSRNDIGMIFYVTIKNIGNFDCNIYANMVKCCEVFGKNDMDCKTMQLIGGKMGDLSPTLTKNISLIYPTLYLHNRYGHCLVSVASVAENFSDELQVNIEFNTLMDDTDPPALEGYYNKKKVSHCSTVDLDPLNSCERVNCQMKYLGSRNYFNYEWNRCQNVPLCIADPDKALPDVSYVPTTNQCKDLEEIVNVGDLQYLHQGLIEEHWKDQVAPMLSANIRCHHGQLSNQTGFCICNEGWATAPIDRDQYEPSLFIYHMCNTKISTWNSAHDSKIISTIVIILVLGAVISLCLLAVSLVCNFLYKSMSFGSSSISLNTGTTSDGVKSYCRVCVVTKSTSAGVVGEYSRSSLTNRSFECKYKCSLCGCCICAQYTSNNCNDGTYRSEVEDKATQTVN